MSSSWAMATSCKQYLAENSSNETTSTATDSTADSNDVASDDFRHSRVWQEFALTNPNGSMSIEAKAKLVTFYDDYINQQVLKFAETNTLSLDQQNQLNLALKTKVTEWISVWQKYLYERFENSKTFRESNPSFYQKEIMALREIIENTPGWFEENIEDFLKNN